MSANLFTNSLPTNAFANVFAPQPAQPSPPSPQVPGGDVQITFDTDMMDEDEVMVLQAPVPPTRSHNANGNPGLQVASAETEMETDGGPEIASEKVHLRGVDSMATGDVESWEKKWVVWEDAVGFDSGGGDVGLKKVEWIDDSSCNLVYSTPTHALHALNYLTDPSPLAPGVSQPTPAQTLDLLLIRQARPCESHPNSRLEVRIARTDDRKQKGARERSRFYLFNPEYDRGEEFERRRREQRRPRRDKDASPIDGPDDGGGYNRRFYDQLEHERRTAGDSYQDNMYDDDNTRTIVTSNATFTLNDRAPRRRLRPRSNTSRSRSRTRSRSRSRYDRDRSYARRRSPPRAKRERIELFPEKVAAEKKTGIMTHKLAGDAFYEPTPVPVPAKTEAVGLVIKGRGSVKAGVELFPEKGAHALSSTTTTTTTTSLQPAKELFPEKLSRPATVKVSASLADRITLRGSSARGVLGYNNMDMEESGPDISSGTKKSGTGRKEDDLFAEKMAMGRRIGLGGMDLMDRIEGVGDASGSGVAGGGGRRKRGRRRAADMFG